VLFLIATLIAAAAAVDSAFDRKEGGARYLGLNRLDIPGSATNAATRESN
jgi:hypothetical protein